MSQQVDSFLKEWQRIVAERDGEALRSILAEDVSIGAPPYWSRLEGRELVHHLLGLVIQAIDGFTYHRQWQEGNELALEFTGRVDGMELQGIDLITLDERGLIAKLDVLMRPINAVGALRDLIAPQMTSYLTERSRAAD